MRHIYSMSIALACLCAMTLVAFAHHGPVHHTMAQPETPLYAARDHHRHVKRHKVRKKIRRATIKKHSKTWCEKHSVKCAKRRSWCANHPKKCLTDTY